MKNETEKTFDAIFSDNFIKGRYHDFVANKTIVGIDKYTEEEFIPLFKVILASFKRSRAFENIIESGKNPAFTIDHQMSHLMIGSYHYIAGYFDAMEAKRMHEAFKSAYYAVKNENS